MLFRLCRSIHSHDCVSDKNTNSHSVITYLAGFNFRNFQSSRQNNRKARVAVGGNYDFGTGTQIQDVTSIVFLHFGVGHVFHIIYFQAGCIKLCKN